MTLMLQTSGSRLLGLIACVPVAQLDQQRRKGEPFRIGKHPQGTEVKAITYSNMQIHTDKPTHDVYVIIDI